MRLYAVGLLMLFRLQYTSNQDILQLLPAGKTKVVKRIFFTRHGFRPHLFDSAIGLSVLCNYLPDHTLGGIYDYVTGQ